MKSKKKFHLENTGLSSKPSIAKDVPKVPIALEYDQLGLVINKSRTIRPIKSKSYVISKLNKAYKGPTI